MEQDAWSVIDQGVQQRGPGARGQRAGAFGVSYAMMIEWAIQSGSSLVHGHAWEARRGVCQDMAHVAIGALRWTGVPAR